MGHTYQAVGWNRQKKVYDRTLVLGVLAYLAVFMGVGAVLQPEATAETWLIRGFGTAALLLLHVVLCIGPLCRLDPRWLPLLYNRRHLGVTMFVLAFAHGALSLLQFHAFGDANPLVSLLTSDGHWGDLARWPFQPFGAGALVIFFLMAATSHDFWLTNLSAPTWKALHMLVHVAYGLLLLHVTYGWLQSDTSPLLVALMGLGMFAVFGLHLRAGLAGRALDVERPAGDDGLVDVCALDDIEDGRARLVTVAGERVAVFRDGDRLAALSNVCQHQNGPLGEGRVVDGCVTCPWHGYQYRLEDGRSPEPFTESVPTFAVQLVDGRVRLDPRPGPAGAAREPCAVHTTEAAS